MEPNMLPVPGGTVYLVPASAVEALAQEPIDLFASPEDTATLDNDEPIEDLLDTNGDYEQAAVDESGVYRFETLPDGSHFVVWTPGDDDTQHLPGGDSSNVAFATASLVGMQMDIRVSSQPSELATYVGSSTCMVCHGLHSTTRTAHNVGLQVPGVRSILQDIEPWPRFDEALAKFGSTTLFYYDCDGAAPDSSKCKVSEGPPPADPPADVFLTVALEEDEGKYSVTLANIKNGADLKSPQSYDVVLTYGGALGKQQYLMRRSNDGSFSYFVLPLQYNYEGDFDNGTEVGDGSSDDWPWRDYRSDLWYDFNTNELFNRSSTGPNEESFNKESFDNNCAGCHFTGYRLEGSDADGWSARAIVDSDGSFDYDGDGRVELINTGCEACHGPGSEHLMPSPNGSHIVSPGLLTPGRQAAVCGSCHSRPLGIGAGETGLPLSEDNQMPPPGIRRADFAVTHTTRVSGDPDQDFFDSGDAFGNYQQYSDHIRSKHYRNPFRLTTCTGCHSPHANSADVAAMDTSGNPNALCTTCHSPDVNPGLYPLTDHIESVTGTSAHENYGPFLCTECHMVPTAKSGAAVPALLDTLRENDTDPRWQYYWNDGASHRMTVTRWTDFAGRPDQPIAFTNECGFCHGAFLPNTTP
jgi:predicted CXXCH cytochrome family protein